MTYKRTYSNWLILGYLSFSERLRLPASAILTPVEVDRAQAYVHHWSQDLAAGNGCAFCDLIAHLGDEPRGGWITSTTRANAMPTLRRTGGLYFSPWACRHLLLRELYAAHGFPAWTALAHAADVPLYRVFKPGLSYMQLRAALGNAQVVPQVGVFTACALASLAVRV